MYIEKVIEHLRYGGRIRRESWTNGLYIQLWVTVYPHVALFVCKNDDPKHRYAITQEEFLADDWEVFK